MIFMTEKDQKLNELYSKLNDLKEGKRILENAMHHNFYNKEIYNSLFLKLNKINQKIKEVKAELVKEKNCEKSRKNI